VLSLGPRPKPTPVRIAYSTASDTRAGLKVWERDYSVLRVCCIIREGGWICSTLRYTDSQH